MPLTYKHLPRGRADFRPLLDSLIQETSKLLPAKTWEWPPMESIVMQLDAMRRWTDNNRDPTPDERKTITIGQIVSREFEPAPDRDTALLNEKLIELADYFKMWLTDKELADFDDTDLLSDFYD